MVCIQYSSIDTEQFILLICVYFINIYMLLYLFIYSYLQHRKIGYFKFFVILIVRAFFLKNCNFRKKIQNNCENMKSKLMHLFYKDTKNYIF